jgi:hypothetical protein
MNDLAQTTWNHSDAQLNARASAGLDKLAANNWGTSQTDVNQWLALTALRGLLCSYLIGSVTTTTDPSGVVTYQAAFDLNDTTQPLERRRAACAVLVPIRAYGSLSYAGQIATQANDVGALIPVGIIAGAAIRIAIIAGGSALIGYAIHQASQIVSGIFNRKADADILEKKDALVLSAVAQHVAAEQQAGKALPLSTATKAVIDSANEASKQVLAKSDPQVSSGLSTVSSWLPNWVPWVGGAAAGAALLGLIFAAVRKVT